MPAAPDFQDPRAAPNYPPYFVDSFPFFELQVTAPESFEVKVADPNPQDTLYVRWVSDYPRFTQASVLLQTEEEVPPGSITYKTAGPANPDGGLPAACARFSPGTDHRLALIVADRPFVAPDLAQNRDYRFNEVSAPRAFAIMAGWSITCP